ncbi:MAG: tungsten formylmethanofuran dehydrogenase [Candidatus Marinimicrobia bacterium]|nr:tungsten formylmethanofuran dehydrogenase [Candidatus Neomarinimicrobiota bacterium]|tara:strand:+ start:4133 stop:6139 length:2007 start_codon:yes stop_codon:yes gene_type:complete
MARLHGFQKKELLDIYNKMYLARTLDEKQLILLKQGKAYFHIGCSGHEGAQLAASNNLNAGKDWVYPYYRDAALCLGLGMTGKEQLLSFLARDDDPNSGGRQMPQHYGHKNLRIVSQSSPTGTQFLQAVGCAMSRKWEKTKEVVYVSSGEGSTSEGEFHEALNWSSREKLPVIFHIQDNQYAISVHISEQTSGASVYSMVGGYQNLSRFDVDGTSFFETDLAFKQAVDRARKGKGPSVIISHVVRLLPHSSSDDQRKYRSDKDLESDKKRDPIAQFEKYCVNKKVASANDFETIRNKVFEQVNKDAEWADKQNHPDISTALDHVYSDQNNLKETSLKTINEKVVLVDAINHAMSEEMSFNKKMVIYGEDIADPKGGVFTATKGLTKQFGKDRVFNSPLAEASIIGTAIGLAVTGWKPCVEIQFGDYIWPAMMQIRNELASMRYRSNGNWKCPLVIRVPVGGYIHGAICHSQSIDGYFMHMPGIKIAYPSNATDAKGLLKAACRMDDPVIFMEHKGLYRQGFSSTPEPDKNYILPFGKAKIVQEGNILTIITWGAMVQKCIESVKACELEQDVVEIIDLRTLNPLDHETISSSVVKTGKALVVHEDNLTNGPGAEIAALIGENNFEYLDGPVKRVGSADAHVPYNWYLEEKVLVQNSDIQNALIELLEY